jgi:MFS family permease
MYAKAAAIIGRPLVLVASLCMSAPAEIALARASGFRGGTEYLAPFVLSLYAVCAAVIAATRSKGVRGRVSAILGAAMALGFSMASQIVAHLIAGGYMTSGPWLTAAVSAVPSVAAAHLLHLAVVPKAPEKAVNAPEKAQEKPKAVIPAAPRKKASQARTEARKPSLQAIRDAAMNLDAVGKKVTGASLAEAMGVSTRTGARYLRMIQTA